MSHWNYRVIRHSGTNPDWECFMIHEVYYNDEGEPYLWTEEPINPSGETVEELKADLEQMLKDIQAPILDLKDLEQLEF